MEKQGLTIAKGKRDLNSKFQMTLQGIEPLVYKVNGEELIRYRFPSEQEHREGWAEFLGKITEDAGAGKNTILVHYRRTSMKREEIIELLEEAGLGAYKDAIASWIFPSQQLVLHPEDEEMIPVGTSKIGGKPDLPADVEWPKWNGYNQTFIAQFNLADFPSMDVLPSDGLLSFFYAVEPMFEDEGFFGDPHTCRVIYTSAGQLDGLIRKNPPAVLSPDAVLKPNRIEISPGLCVPASESAYLESIGLGWDGNREDFDKYWDVFLKQFRERRPSENYINRLLGHPDQIQGDMQIGCEMKMQRLSGDRLRDPDMRQHVVQGALNWRLLLQVDSEEEKTGMMWGDVGRIYFWIREDDLAALRFDRVVCEMQCC